MTGMVEHTRARDPEAERMERDAYRVLRHLHETAGAAEGGVVATRSAADALALEAEYAERVAGFLEREGLLSVGAEGISLTVPGAAYVENLAWRRRSVRRRWS